MTFSKSVPVLSPQLRSVNQHHGEHYITPIPMHADRSTPLSNTADMISSAARVLLNDIDELQPMNLTYAAVCNQANV